MNFRRIPVLALIAALAITLLSACASPTVPSHPPTLKTITLKTSLEPCQSVKMPTLDQSSTTTTPIPYFDVVVAWVGENAVTNLHFPTKPPVGMTHRVEWYPQFSQQTTIPGLDDVTLTLIPGEKVCVRVTSATISFDKATGKMTVTPASLPVITGFTIPQRQ